jgi:hypothetical protein
MDRLQDFTLNMGKKDMSKKTVVYFKAFARSYFKCRGVIANALESTESCNVLVFLNAAKVHTARLMGNK